MRVPMITAREWRSIAPLLPPTGGPGKPRQDDRRFVSAFFYSEATRSSLDSLPLVPLPDRVLKGILDGSHKSSL